MWLLRAYVHLVQHQGCQSKVGPRVSMPLVADTGALKVALHGCQRWVMDAYSLPQLHR